MGDVDPNYDNSNQRTLDFDSLRIHFRIHPFQAHQETKFHTYSQFQSPGANSMDKAHRPTCCIVGDMSFVNCEMTPSWNSFAELLDFSWLPTRRQILLWTARSRVSASSFLVMLSIWCDGQSMTWDWVESSSSFYFGKPLESLSGKIGKTDLAVLLAGVIRTDGLIDGLIERPIFWPV